MIWHARRPDIKKTEALNFSSLWAQPNSLFGISASNTTAYHPQANGIVERLHYQPKASLKARKTGPNWMEELLMVLLWHQDHLERRCWMFSCRTCVGTDLHLPGKVFIISSSRELPDTSGFLQHLRETMHNVLYLLLHNITAIPKHPTLRI